MKFFPFRAIHFLVCALTISALAGCQTKADTKEQLSAPAPNYKPILKRLVWLTKNGIQTPGGALSAKVVASADEGFFLVGSVDDSLIIYKYNSQHQRLWSKLYDNHKDKQLTFYDNETQPTIWVEDAKSTTDGGLIVACTADYHDETKRGNGSPLKVRKKDCFLYKISSAGKVEWTKILGGTWEESEAKIEICPDGSYVAGCTSRSPASAMKSQPSHETSDVNPYALSEDVWIIKLDQQGNTVWDKSYGSASAEQCVAIKPVPGGYLVLATTDGVEPNGDVTERSLTGKYFEHEPWFFRLNSQGKIVSSRRINPRDYGIPFGMAVNRQGEAVVVSYVNSKALYYKLSETNEVVWVEKVKSDKSVMLNQVLTTGDGGYVLAGEIDSEYSGSQSITVSGRRNDFFVMNINEKGEKKASKIFGSENEETHVSIAITPNGKLLLAGECEDLKRPLNKDGRETTDSIETISWVVIDTEVKLKPFDKSAPSAPVPANTVSNKRAAEHIDDAPPSSLTRGDAAADDIIGTWQGTIGDKPFTLTIERVTGNKISGWNKTGNNKRPVSGDFTANSEEGSSIGYEIELKEPGSDKWDGKFDLLLMSPMANMAPTHCSGTWKAFNGQLSKKIEANKVVN